MKCSALYRWMVVGCGLAFLALGYIGFIVPGLPGTIFLILALACFQRSCPPMEQRMLENKMFGPVLRDWRATGAISAPVKAISCTCIILMSGRSIWKVETLWAKALMAVLMVAGVAYILSRPTKRKSSANEMEPIRASSVEMSA